ncbi:hypothetical protein AWC29_21000 [Mycobacterium triplex]|uniref:Uncharacterized protein n=1 Tax=Mycobacterium triplex TaxID=47839 RepID=A0A024JXF0_9MYCO|nr:hypothetical protein [Mycobacterium triplex]ORX02318.1 hypothetical protein AWC29_21000 [Mycobacterium triplex]CDO88219.1 hypothetical protein BN973_02583 [Mycobacterium triplex]
MAYLAVIAVYVVAAGTALAGFWLTAVLFVGHDYDAAGVIMSAARRVAGRGPLLIAAGVALGLLGNLAANHLPPASASDLVAPSHPSDLCDLNDGLFGLCGAGQLRR